MIELCRQAKKGFVSNWLVFFQPNSVSIFGLLDTKKGLLVATPLMMGRKMMEKPTEIATNKPYHHSAFMPSSHSIYNYTPFYSLINPP